MRSVGWNGPGGGRFVAKVCVKIHPIIIDVGGW
jgi:hypothetical protein